MPPEEHRTHLADRRELWFGLLGGGVAWVTHLVLAYLLTEWGCGGALHAYHDTVLGIHGVAWALIGMSAATLALAVAAAVVSYRVERGLQAEVTPGTWARAPEPFVARTGTITSVLFAVIIVVQSVPIFFFLRDC